VISICDQAVHDRREVPGRDHQALGQLSQHKPARFAVELSENIEARHREIELFAKPAPQLAFDQGRAGEQPEPDSRLSPVLGFLIRPVPGRNRRGLLRECQSNLPGFVAF
jgi:hypothetical protein